VYQVERREPVEVAAVTYLKSKIATMLGEAPDGLSTTGIAVPASGKTERGVHQNNSYVVWLGVKSLPLPRNCIQLFGNLSPTNNFGIIVLSNKLGLFRFRKDVFVSTAVVVMTPNRVVIVVTIINVVRI
jgi:hypothetical protein